MLSLISLYLSRYCCHHPFNPQYYFFRLNYQTGNLHSSPFCVEYLSIFCEKSCNDKGYLDFHIQLVHAVHYALLFMSFLAFLILPISHIDLFLAQYIFLALRVRNVLFYSASSPFVHNHTLERTLVLLFSTLSPFLRVFESLKLASVLSCNCS